MKSVAFSFAPKYVIYEKDFFVFVVHLEYPERAGAGF
jgi:hypothetical protein